MTGDLFHKRLVDFEKDMAMQKCCIALVVDNYAAIRRTVQLRYIILLSYTFSLPMLPQSFNPVTRGS